MDGSVHREMTVAILRDRPGAEAVKVAFLESARFYDLPRTHPRFEELLARLRDAKDQGRTLTIQLASLDSGLIEDVEVG